MGIEFKMPQYVFGVKLKDKEKIMQSQSGGAFAAIAEYFLNVGAIVYGCSLDSNHTAVYSRITNISELNKIKGSKYVQASLGNTFDSIKTDLKNGYTVLFSGTPCYVAAVKEFSKNMENKEKLFTVDIICHGVPSPLVYKAYLSELSEKEHSDIKQYIFRDKNQRVDKTRERIIYSNGKEEAREDYVKLFYTNLPLRPSCGECHFAKIARVSDFTVGDFWGVKNSYPDFNDYRGVSIVFCNNERSIEVFDAIKDTFEIMQTDIAHAMQPNLKGPSKIPFFKNLFWKDFRKKGVLYCSKKWPPIVEFPSVVKARLRKIIKGK